MKYGITSRVEFRQSILNNENIPCEKCWVESNRELQYRVEQSTRFILVR